MSEERIDWPQCNNCGRPYRFEEEMKAGICAVCVTKQGSVALRFSPSDVSLLIEAVGVLLDEREKPLDREKMVDRRRGRLVTLRDLREHQHAESAELRGLLARLCDARRPGSGAST